MTHECPAPTCAEQAAPDMLMCPQHWYLVPKPLRKAVWAAWRRGAGAGSPAHRAAMRAAISAVSRAQPVPPLQVPTSDTRPAAGLSTAQLRDGADHQDAGANR